MSGIVQQQEMVALTEMMEMDGYQRGIYDEKLIISGLRCLRHLEEADPPLALSQHWHSEQVV